MLTREEKDLQMGRDLPLMLTRSKVTKRKTKASTKVLLPKRWNAITKITNAISVVNKVMHIELVL